MPSNTSLYLPRPILPLVARNGGEAQAYALERGIRVGVDKN